MQTKRKNTTGTAAGGNSQAMYNLGLQYEQGKGIAKDYAQALAWYHKSVDAGNAGAMDALGDMYRGGKGVAMDQKIANEWYRKAAAAGDADAVLLPGQGVLSGARRGH